MKARDIKELQTKTEAELRAMLKETKESLSAARLEHAQRKLSNTTSLTSLRHDIARMRTMLVIKSQNKVSQVATEGKTVVNKGGKA